MSKGTCMQCTMMYTEVSFLFANACKAWPGRHSNKRLSPEKFCHSLKLNTKNLFDPQSPLSWLESLISTHGRSYPYTPDFEIDLALQTLWIYHTLSQLGSLFPHQRRHTFFSPPPWGIETHFFANQTSPKGLDSEGPTSV